MRVNFCAENFLNLKGIYFFALQKDKCQEKVWEKGVEFEEGKKDLSSKGLFPLIKYLPLLKQKKGHYLWIKSFILLRPFTM